VHAFIALLKTLAIMTLAAFGARLLTTAASDDQVGDAGFGVLFLLGAFFLYRAWFMRR
jgi:hypothetical protein